MKTISIRLSDEDYAQLDQMLSEMGQTKQSFYETYTKTALRERRIPFIIRAPYPASRPSKMDRLGAFSRLEAIRKSADEYVPADFDTNKELEEALHEKYGNSD